MAGNTERATKESKAMKRIFLTLCVLSILSVGTYAAGPADISREKQFLRPVLVKRTVKVNGYPVHARGKKGRKFVRRFALKDNLKRDKLLAYEEYGFTPHRLRVRSFGESTERWRYYSLGLELVFDDEGNLIKKSRFSREPGHID